MSCSSFLFLRKVLLFSGRSAVGFFFHCCPADFPPYDCRWRDKHFKALHQQFNPQAESTSGQCTNWGRRLITGSVQSRMLVLPPDASLLNFISFHAPVRAAISRAFELATISSCTSANTVFKSPRKARLVHSPSSCADVLPSRRMFSLLEATSGTFCSPWIIG